MWVHRLPRCKAEPNLSLPGQLAHQDLFALDNLQNPLRSSALNRLPGAPLVRVHVCWIGELAKHRLVLPLGIPQRQRFIDDLAAVKVGMILDVCVNRPQQQGIDGCTNPATRSPCRLSHHRWVPNCAAWYYES